MTTAAASTASRPIVSGKFFRIDGKKFCPKGVTYGPFAPNTAGEPFREREQTARDFALIGAARGEPAPGLLRAAALAAGSRPQARPEAVDRYSVSKHLCFLDSAALRREACEAVRTAVKACARHPAVFAYSVVNEIPPDISRWSGGRAVEGFVESLVDVAKEADPECLCTFGNYPPTEFLRPENIDFLCFNVYLHQQRAFENYLARLQMIADEKPLMLGEIGIDSIRRARKPRARSWNGRLNRPFAAAWRGW